SKANRGAGTMRGRARQLRRTVDHRADRQASGEYAASGRKHDRRFGKQSSQRQRAARRASGLIRRNTAAVQRRDNCAVREALDASAVLAEGVEDRRVVHIGFFRTRELSRARDPRPGALVDGRELVDAYRERRWRLLVLTE